MKVFDYKDKLIREKLWYEKENHLKQNIFSKILHLPLFFSIERFLFNYYFAKHKMVEVVLRYHTDKINKLLIAPCGTGEDYKFFCNITGKPEIHGIDISSIAVKRCPDGMKAKEGDILNSGYSDEEFDLIVSPLFFHHMLKVGFVPFLQEFHRILRKEGMIVILEPSIWYPLNLITRPLKRILKNPFDEIEDEDPFHPGTMIKSLQQAKFSQINIKPATFSHCSFYVPLAKLINFITNPILEKRSFAYFSWLVIYWAKKL